MEADKQHPNAEAPNMKNVFIILNVIGFYDRFTVQSAELEKL